MLISTGLDLCAMWALFSGFSDERYILVIKQNICSGKIKSKGVRVMSMQKSEIKLEANGKPLDAYLASSSGGGPAVLVLPSWWGLKPYFKQVCDQLAGQGYTALAPDYYNGRVANSVDEAKALQPEVESDPDVMRAIVKAAKDHLTSLRPGQSMGILGFSMGTDWAVITAANEMDIAATVLFYGGWSLDFSKMRSKVLGHYAETDEWYPFDNAKEMAQNMKDASVDVTLYLYPGTAHWFMEEDRPEYDPAAASLAWERTIMFLKQSLP
jgi:carboxymethylenebutenolidase